MIAQAAHASCQLHVSAAHTQETHSTKRTTNLPGSSHTGKRRNRISIGGRGDVCQVQGVRGKLPGVRRKGKVGWKVQGVRWKVQGVRGKLGGSIQAFKNRAAPTFLRADHFPARHMPWPATRQWGPSTSGLGVVGFKATTGSLTSPGLCLALLSTL